MEILLPLVIGALALFYVCQPLWAGASLERRQTRFEGWHSLEQLEFDRQIGKIDDAEFEELQKRVPVEAPAPAIDANLLENLISGARGQSRLQNPIENLIFQARRQKRAHNSLESEILIARARQRGTRKRGDKSAPLP